MRQGSVSDGWALLTGMLWLELLEWLVSSQMCGGGVVGCVVQSLRVLRSPVVRSRARSFLLSSCFVMTSGSCSSAMSS